MATSTMVVSEARFEREHVIKVLEHERKIYKLETSITGSTRLEDSESEDGGRRGRALSGFE
jgi:hypothetical protein